jgi:phosphatidylserine/phosphatidylglycerophosphate/cardiolipin synthase-like enzyme
MKVNIKHTDQFNSGAYILNSSATSYTPIKSTRTVFLTQENNDSLKNEILKLIGQSKSVLKICSFIITDKEIFEAILDKAENSNISIFVLTQLDQTKLTSQFSLLDYLTEEEIKENPSQAHLRHIKKLFDSGVHVRASLSAHAKFIIADRDNGFITSANLTTPSLTFNTESGVYLTQKDSRELDKLFDVIFQTGTSYRQFISSTKKNKIFVVQSEVKIRKDVLPDSAISNLRYTYENESNNLYEELISIINSASEYLYISTYSIVGLDSLGELTQAIKDALERGVEIFVFCRGMNYRNDHLIASRLLSSNGCKIFADLFNHSKGIISEKTGMIFTANIDGFHGLKNGFEVGYVLQEEQRAEFLKIHKSLIETAYYIFKDTPSRVELFETYRNYEKAKGLKAPEFPNDIFISVKNGMEINISDLSELPLFYGKSRNADYLIAGHTYFKCRVVDNHFEISEKENPRFDLERYLLKYVSLKII